MGALTGRIAVISPHLDDAALSLGASIAAATGAGAQVRVVTVLANDPETTAPVSPWDAACGFSSAAEAAAERRAEDRRACEILGAEPVWLPFGDHEYGLGASPEEVAQALTDAVAESETVLLPGFPLSQPDHAFLTHTALQLSLDGRRLGLYVEQPYAALRLMGRGRRATSRGLSTARGARNLAAILLRTARGRRLAAAVLPAGLAGLAHQNGGWQPLPATRADRDRKRRALRAYRSQLDGFGPLVLQRISAYERAANGEAIAWVE